MIENSKFYMVVTPFLISPKEERFDLLLLPWGKVGKGVKSNKDNGSFINIYTQ